MLFAVMVTALMLAQPVSAAAALTSVVDDPAGDAFISFNPQRPGEPFQDMVRAEVSLKDGVFSFVVELVAPIPASPVLPAGIALELWRWGLDTDPATFPVGFPFPPGASAPPEFLVDVLWDGFSFRGFVIDRRPLLTSGEAIITPVAFDMKAAKLTVSVNADLLGDPSSFTWISRTDDDPSHLGTEAGGTHDVDLAPDAGRAPWPS